MQSHLIASQLQVLKIWGCKSYSSVHTWYSVNAVNNRIYVVMAIVKKLSLVYLHYSPNSAIYQFSNISF